MITANSDKSTELLRSAAARAALAPSVHNTQPWRFRLGPDWLELRTERGRLLRVADPAGRQQLVSQGCALFNARVAFAVAGQEVAVHRLPDSDDPELLARIELTGRPAAWSPLVRLDTAIERRHSNRREFFASVVPDEVKWELMAAARAERSRLIPVDSEAHRVQVARLLWEAVAEEQNNPAYRAELRQWTSDIASRRDGVTTQSFPRAEGARGDIPIRDFGVKVSGQMPPVNESGRDQCLMILGSAEDSPLGWLRAGEALERVWLEATRLDYVASLFTQLVEVPELREELRLQLGLSMSPLVLLRVGRATPNVATNRRPLDQLIEES